MIHSIAILAQSARVDELGHRFRYGANLNPRDFAIVILVLGAIAIFVWLLARLAKESENSPYNDSKRLFKELCRAHRLNFWERALLRRVAQAKGVSQAAMVFVNPELLESIPAGLARYERSLRNLQAKLFAYEEAAPAA